MQSTRDASIDIFRGGCIVSMAVAHIALGSVLWAVLHPIPVFDGASGFVLISGIVMGMVYRRSSNALGAKAVRRRQFKRLALLYSTQIALVVLAIIVGAVVGDATHLPHLCVPISTAVWWLTTLQINPTNIDILSVYVVMVALTFVWVPLLRARKGWVVLALSLVMYSLGSMTGHGALPNRPSEQAAFNALTWQLLFTGGMLAGWYWASVRPVILRASAVWITALAFVLVMATGALTSDSEVGTVLFAKKNLGIGRLMTAFMVFVLVYFLICWAVRHGADRILRPIEAIGRRSLACFVTLCVGVVLVPLAIGNDSRTGAAEVAAVFMCVLLYGIAVIRDRTSSHFERASTAIDRVVLRNYGSVG
ncbi:OpgC domain-containing protein [Gordonia sp. NPDC003429]